MGNTSGQEMNSTTIKNNSTNGKSTNAKIVADEIKLRIASKDCSPAVNDPTDAGRSDNFIPSTRSIILAESVTSTRLAARSTNHARIMRNTKSALIAINIPKERTQSVSVA